jgi:cobalamin biosynthesis protein CbiG
MPASVPGLILGLGCVRGAPEEEVLALAQSVLSAAPALRPGETQPCLLAVASLDARATEPALLAVARYFAVPFLTYDVARLAAMTAHLATPSALVHRLTGCHGVAEAAALAAAIEGDGVLIVPKRRSAHATAALVLVPSKQALAPGSCQIESRSSQIDSSAPPVLMAVLEHPS